MVSTLSSPLELRPYQKNAVSDISESIAEYPTLYQLPTGAGKTEIGLAVARQTLNDGATVVWLTHRVELIDQTMRRAEDAELPVHDAYSTRIYKPNVFNIMSVGKASSKRRRSELPTGSLLIVDEAHHTPAKTWSRVIRQHSGPVLGLTATPWRLSKREGFKDMFDRLVIGPQYRELIEGGYLVEASIIVPKDANDRFDVERLKVHRTGDYILSGLGIAAFDLPMSLWEKHCQDRQTIVYAANQEVAVKIADALHDRGVGVGLLLSDGELAQQTHTSVETERSVVVEKFRCSELSVVVNVEILTEGFDCPGADAVIIGRPTKSLTLYRQMIGRCMRPAPGKTDAVVIDCGASVLEPTIGHYLDDYDWSLKPRADKNLASDMPQRYCDECQEQGPISAKKCGSCDKPFGTQCPRCREFRFGYFGGGRYCDPCELELKRKRLRKDPTPTVVVKPESEKSFFLKGDIAWKELLQPWNQHEHVDCNGHCNADWGSIHHLAKNENGWAVVYFGELPLKVKQLVSVTKRSGENTNQQVIARWCGPSPYRRGMGKSVSVCEILESRGSEICPQCGKRKRRQFRLCYSCNEKEKYAVGT